MYGAEGKMSQIRILLVEDDLATRESLTEVLVSRGYPVDSAASAMEGLGFLRSAHYGLVVTDFSMPGSTGTAMLEEAADEGLLEGSKALLITGHQPDNPANVEVFHKPLDMQKFLFRVEEILHPEGRRVSQAPKAPPGATFFVDSDTLDRMDDRTRKQFAARVNELSKRGTALYCWSSKDPSQARKFAEGLGVAHCFRGFLPKPTVLVSETPFHSWNLSECSSAQLTGQSVDELLTH